jgi:phosphatidylinositol alpha 1,6-mannosyltransferase
LRRPRTAELRCQHPRFTNRPSTRHRRLTIRSLSRCCTARVNMTLAPSPTAARDLERHGIPRVQVWPRGVDTTAFSSAHRNADLRLAWLRRGRSSSISWAGWRPRSRSRTLRCSATCPASGLSSSVTGRNGSGCHGVSRGPTSRGVLSGIDLSRAVASLDVVVHPGPHETFCQAAQEAMASGVPVVAVGAGGLLDLVDSSRTGWLYPPGLPTSSWRPAR